MKFLVAYDIPRSISNAGQIRFYREIKRIAVELGFEKVGGSVYEISGDDADIRAHVLAQLAAEFGAGKVGEKDGPHIVQLVEESPETYFANRDLAKKVVEELLVDHRTRDNKKKARSITTIVAELRGEALPDDFTKALKAAATAARSEPRPRMKETVR